MGGILIVLSIAALIFIFTNGKKKPVKQTSSTGKGKKKRTSSARSHAIQSNGSGGGKKKQQKKEEHFQRHFRKFHSSKTTGHPSYVYGEEGKDYKIIGLTSSPETNEEKNIKLDKNPEPGNSEQAYIRPKSMKINKGVKNEKLKGWSFTGNDKKKVQAVIDKDKK